eukprot:5161677-Karenia_brevis.AAC.1
MLLKNADGSWHSLKVDGFPLFINLDENTQCAQTGAAARTLLRLLLQKYPGIKAEFPVAYRPRFHPKRMPEAILTCDKIDLVTIKVPGPFDSPELFWAPGQ